MEWVTMNGRHFPVNSDDENDKKRQIEFNKKEADKRNNTGGGKSSKSGKKPGLSKLDKLNNKKSKGGKK